MVVALLLQGVQAGLEILRLRLPRKDQMEALAQPIMQRIAMAAAVVVLPQLALTALQAEPAALAATVRHHLFLAAL